MFVAFLAAAGLVYCIKKLWRHFRLNGPLFQPKPPTSFKPLDPVPGSWVVEALVKLPCKCLIDANHLSIFGIYHSCIIGYHVKTSI